MDLHELKRTQVESELGITSEIYGRTLAIIDFGNVNHWFQKDRQDADYLALADNERLVVDLAQLKDFSALFASDTRFYYGLDQENEGSRRFITAARHVFGKSRVFTKPIQKVKHYLEEREVAGNTRNVSVDREGEFVQIPKCNFDVEIAVDSIRCLEAYDTLALFSSDADFVTLVRYLKKQGKKVILVKGGYITSGLRGAVDKVINAQSIKRHITTKKQKPGG